MEITFHCGQCGQRIEVDQTAGGTELPCPNCGATQTVPSLPARPKIRIRGVGANIEPTPATPPTTANPPCPKCRQPLSIPDAVICVNCGHDLRIETPVATERERRRPGRTMLVVLALLVMGVSLTRLWQEFRPARLPRPGSTPSTRTTIFGRLKPVVSGKTYADAWQVASYQLTAEPWWSSNRPAVQVRARLQVALNSSLPSFWPGAVAVEVLRADQPAGPFRPVIIQGEADVRRPVGSSDPITLTPNAPLTRHHYEYGFVDPGVAAGQRYFYKLRFLDGREKPLFETGSCSTIPLTLPVMRIETNASGAPAQLTWTLAACPTNTLASSPQHTLGFPGLYDLQRGELASGSLVLAQPLVAPLVSAVTASIRADQWEYPSRQSSVTTPVTIQETIAGHSPPRSGMHVFPRSEPAPEAIFCRIAEIGSGPYFHRVVAGAGVQQVVWQLSAQRHMVSLEMSGAASGTQRWAHADKSLYLHSDGAYHGGPELARPIWPGTAERLTLVYAWSESNPPRTCTARVEIVRAPLPPRLSAQSEDGQVVLRWPPLAYDPADWLDGPWLSLRRYSGSGVVRVGDRLQFQAAEEIFRGPGTATSYRDDKLTNGVAGFYTLDVNGVTRARSWAPGSGNYECFLPLCVRGEVATAEEPLLAIPAPPHVLRLAFLADATGVSGTDPRANVLQAQCLRALGRTPWIELLDRSLSPAVLAERQLVALQAGAAAAPLAADAVLHWRIRQRQYDRYFDLWLEDFQQQRKTRVVSQSLAHVDATAVGEQLIAALTAWFPDAPHYPVKPAEPPRCSPIRTIAVTSFQPLSANTVLPDEFEDLLVAALGKTDCLVIVDRGQLARAMRELGTGKLTDQSTAVKLGQILHADAVLSGFYQLSTNDVAVSARLLDAGTGRLLSVVELTGSPRDFASLATRLAGSVFAAAKSLEPPTDSAWWRWLEAQSYARNPTNPFARPAAAVVAPDSAEHQFALGQEQQARGELEEAAGSYRTGLALAEKSEDPWRFYVALGAVLDQLGQPEERCQLWDRAVADRTRRQADPTEALYNLAQSQRQAGHRDLAAATLAKIQPDKGTYAIGREYEAVGRTNEAIAIYGPLAWKSASQFSGDAALGPGYAALVRLVSTGSDAVIVAALKRIARATNHSRPQQFQQAIRELAHRGADLAEFATTAQLVSELPPERLTAIVEAHPHSLEALEAQMSLAGQAHRNQDEPTARRYWQAIATAPLTGLRADQLREMARARLERSDAPPRPGGARPPATAPREPIASLGADRLLVDTAAVVYRVTAHNEVLWRCDPRARAPDQNTTGSHGFGRAVAHQLYDASANSRRWYNMNYSIEAYITDLRLLAGAMLLDGETMYAPDLVDGTLTALDVVTGKPRWTFVAWSPLTRPVLLAGKLWVGDSLGGLHQLDPADGKVMTELRLPTDQVERGYCEQLLQLNVDTAAVRLTFINPRYTANYRTTQGLQRREFESHHFDLATVPLGQSANASTPPTPQRVIPSKATRAYTAAIAQAQNPAEREQAVPVLLELLDDNQETAALRAAAINALSQTCGVAFRPRLVQLADSPVPEIRRAALAWLGRLGDRGDVALLRRHLTDPHVPASGEAITALVRLYGAEARTALKDVLQQSGTQVRSRLVLELVKAGDREAIPLLKESAPDESYLKDDDVLVALCHANDPAGLAELARRFDWTQANMEPLTTALLLGNRLPEPRFGDFLRNVFSVSQRWGLHPTFAPGLAALGDPASIPTLYNALPGDVAIVTALEDLSGESFGTNRVRWEEWWEKAERHFLAATPNVPQVKSAP